jgi:hypothetical protein
VGVFSNQPTLWTTVGSTTTATRYPAPVNFTNYTAGCLSSIFVTPTGDIHAGGWSFTNANTRRPTSWVNGVGRVHEDATTDNFAYTGIYVDEADTEYLVTSNFSPRYGAIFVNGSLTRLPAQSTSEARGVYASNGNWVAVGQDTVSGQLRPVIWRNGAEAVTEEVFGVNGGLWNVFVQNNDFYYSGWRNSDNYTSLATYWKNSIANMVTYPTPTTGSADAIHARCTDTWVEEDGTIHSSGYTHNDNFGMYFPVYWKNGNPVRLTTGTVRGDTWKIFVYNGDIYIAGRVNINTTVASYYPCFWKSSDGGETFELTVLNSTTTGYCYSIWVVPQ